MNSKFDPRRKCDANSFFSFLVNKFFEENPLFKLVKYHFFGFIYETDRYYLFKDINQSTFLYNYITLLMLMTEKKEKEATIKKFNILFKIDD